MPPSERDLKLLWDMVRAAQDAVNFTSDCAHEAYLEDTRRRMAVERVISIIGEAARKVSPEARAQLPGIEWGAIVATRHIIVHQYDEVDHEKIWRIVTIHLPALIDQIAPILDANPPGPESLKDPGEP